MTVTLQGHKFSGTFFHKDSDTDYFEGPLFGQLGVRNTYTLKELHSIHSSESHIVNYDINDNDIIYQFEEDYPSKKKEFSFKMESFPNGNKIMDITLENLTINLRLVTLMALSNFGSMDETCTPNNPLTYL